MRDYLLGVDVLGAAPSLGTQQLKIDPMFASSKPLPPLVPPPSQATIDAATAAQAAKAIDAPYYQPYVVPSFDRGALVPSRQQAQTDADFEAKRVAARNMLLIIAGCVLGAGFGGALLWRDHRVAGFLLGSLIVGPIVGGTSAALYGSSKVKRVQT